MKPLSWIVLLVACGDDASSPSDTAGADTAAATDTGAETTTEVVETETVATEVIADTTFEFEIVQVEEACSEIGAADCFSNYDCASELVCENVSASELEIPCCVAGVRGTKASGEPCVSESDCESGVCIARNEGPELCSARCNSGDPACSGVASECVTLPFVPDSWCVPPAEPR